jgi:hypothetical protein
MYSQTVSALISPRQLGVKDMESAQKMNICEDGSPQLQLKYLVNAGKQEDYR